MWRCCVGRGVHGERKDRGGYLGMEDLREQQVWQERHSPGGGAVRRAGVRWVRARAAMVPKHTLRGCLEDGVR